MPVPGKQISQLGKSKFDGKSEWIRSTFATRLALHSGKNTLERNGDRQKGGCGVVYPVCVCVCVIELLRDAAARRENEPVPGVGVGKGKRLQNTGDIQTKPLLFGWSS